MNKVVRSPSNIVNPASRRAALSFVRLTLARVSTIGVQNGVIAGRRAVAVGAASELDKILPHDLRRLGIEEVARVGVIQSDESMGVGERGRAQIGDAINLARDLRATEFCWRVLCYGIVSNAPSKYCS
jgi:hypothetical protein